jgi:hypothetical protein
MCGECEQTEGLAAVYLRKTNRYGWRPPAAPATAPRYHDEPAGTPSGTRPALTCSAAKRPNRAEVTPCA